MDRVTPPKPSVGDEVMLPLTSEQNGQRIDVFVYNQPKALDYTKAINLRHIDEHGFGGDALSYRLGKDGVVRRVDMDKPTPDETEADESSDLFMDEEDGVRTATPVDMLSKLLQQRKQILEGRENFRLETSMGVNNQPVGLTEIEAVIEFVKTAKPKG